MDCSNNEQVAKAISGLKEYHPISSLQLPDLRRTFAHMTTAQWKEAVSYARRRFNGRPELGIKVGSTVVKYHK